MTSGPRGSRCPWPPRSAHSVARGRRTTIYQELADLPALAELPRYVRHPCTVAEAQAVRAALGAKWGPIWWALCCHGLGPKEYWKDGWTLTRAGLEVQGQKRPARNRVVPLVCPLPPAVGRPAGFAQALARADLGVTPYDTRRTYARWLDELRLPGYRQDAYMGHGPKSMRELYRFGEIQAWIAEDGQALRRYVGEERVRLEVQA